MVNINEAEEENVSRKKANVTLSIESILLDSIKKKVKEKGISVNAEMNTILSKYAFCYRFSEIQAGVILPCSIFSAILDAAEEENISKLYKSIILQNIESIFVRENISLTIENLMKYAFNGILLYSGSYTDFSYFVDKEGQLNLIFSHEYGNKWSHIIGLAYSEFIEKLLGLHVGEPVMLSKNVTIKILEKNNWAPDS